MDTTSLISQIDEEILRLEKIKTALSGFLPTLKYKLPLKSVAAKAPAKRAISAEARANMIAGQKKRHLKAKRAAKAAAKTAAAPKLQDIHFTKKTDRPSPILAK